MIDDDVPENDKNFELVIIGSSLRNGFTRGDIRRSTVMIVDDDKQG